ncbi:MAG: PleD family two-component system response regulator [Rickettsiaceae bacterium]|nr:MAG: PleD family two-component system response regulator [Rickettsiaceae bacterium]
MTANILVVDDLEPNIKLLEAKLLIGYYTVFTANSGTRAIEILKEQKIDVVLLDVMMPGMDGFEACRRIKTNPDTMHIPVIMVTALSDIEDKIKGLEAGADEFLTKPIDDTSLFARVKSLSRMKTIIDELKLRNKTNAALGASVIELEDNFTNSKTLLISDDVIQIKNLSKVISKISPQIKVMTKMSELNIINSYTPDLAIISCQFEAEDPLRISVMLKSREEFNHTIFMLLAEEENLPMVIQGIELGMNDYCIYPVDENELIARLKTQLRRKQYHDNLRNELEESVNLSIKDGLTGLFNRRYFDTHIMQMIKRCCETNHPLCLMILDIDHFKKVNDLYGHQAGDEILIAFTNILKQDFRATDLISRYGGEEFAILLYDTSLDEAISVAQRVKCRVEDKEFTIQNLSISIKKTASVGISLYIKHESVNSFIKRADKALYEAKDQGRNKIVADKTTAYLE